MIPRATYRLQFHKGFTFADAARHAPYFADLGVSHIYASPILAARAGSMHGYDVVDHSRVNPELGGEEGLRAMIAVLKSHGLGLIVDIVPNHMAVGGADNAWWLDVLAKGQESAFARFFDIDWDAPGLTGKVLAPFLDGVPEAAWEKGDLTLQRETAGGWAFAYFQHRFPLRPEDQEMTAPPAAWADIASLLSRQHFVLADWRQANSCINWRRFFDVTDLAGLRMEDAAAFEAVHQKIFALYDEGLIDGLRVDHVDGLADPAAYCRALRARMSRAQHEPYLIVEKILAQGEILPVSWHTHGTTGYDAMNDLSALQHADDGGQLEAIWQEYTDRSLRFDEEEGTARKQLLHSSFQAQRNATCRAFAHALPQTSPAAIAQQTEASLAQLRFYRGYQTAQANSPPLECPLSHALKDSADLRSIFLERSGDASAGDALRRFHQLSAPIAAKAVEDTAFYRYGRLLSRNDVGFDPRCHLLAPDEFHSRALLRQRYYPYALLTTASHDHKRGEDARARLAVLSALPHWWRSFVKALPPTPLVHLEDVYMLCQTLLGAWTSSLDATFVDRIEQWCRKHLREAKLRSSWHAADTTYEGHFCALARHLILDPQEADFRTRMESLLSAITPLARANSLAQVLLRYTLPGVPDLYQGTEFADFSLVDPDNRRAVDYEVRAASLANLGGSCELDHQKQALIARVLSARRQRPQLWADGDYTPITAPKGFIAYRRQLGALGLFVVARCNSASTEAMLNIPWSGLDVVSQRVIEAGEYPSSDLLQDWPGLALLSD